MNWKVYSGDKSFLFRGVCGAIGTRELLFSIPIINSGKGSRGSEPGTITVVEFEAIYRGSEYKHWKGVSLSPSRASDPTFRPSSKEGRLLERINPMDCFTSGTWATNWVDTA